MTRAELRAQRKRMRQALTGLKRRMRAQVAQNPAVKRARRRERVRRAAVLAVLVLLLLFVRCECEPTPPIVPPQVVPAAVVPARPTPPVTPPPPPPLKARVSKQPRGKFGNEPRDTPSWLEEFHLQVSARSGRLSTCFAGSERPGALRWAAALNAKSGKVSDHEVEPLGAPTGFTNAQRDCVVRVLSEPAYRLEMPAAEELPRRVGLVIEF